MADYKILVIDYEPRGIRQLCDPLRAAGHEVHVANDGVTGSELFETLKPDLTLIEAMLPKKHGFEVCQDLKKTTHGASSPIVIVTSVYRGRKYRTQALHNYGCDEYLEKPVTEETLLSIVDRLVTVPRAAAAPAPAPPTAEPEAARPPEAPPVPAAAVEPTAAPAAGTNEAEDEISERLDELFGGASETTKASVDSDRVLSFDPTRARSRTASQSGTNVAPTVGNGSMRSRGSAMMLERPHETDAVGSPTVDVKPRVTPRPQHRVAPVRQGTQRTGRVWIVAAVVMLAVAAAVLAWLWPF